MGYPFYTTEEAEKALQVRGYQTDAQSKGSIIGCTCMLVERMTGLSFPPELCLRFAERCGMITDPTGYMLLAGAIAGRFSLQLRYYNNQSDALSSWTQDAKAIVYDNEAGTLPGSRVFLIDRFENDTMYVLNPDYPGGKHFPRNRKKLLRIQDEYMLMTADICRELYGDQNKAYFVFNPGSVQ